VTESSGDDSAVDSPAASEHRDPSADQTPTPQAEPIQVDTSESEPAEPVAEVASQAEPAAADEVVEPQDEATEDEATEDDPKVAAAAPAPPPPAPRPAKTSMPAVETETEEEGKMDWYILKVAFNREDSIADTLRKRVKMEGMAEYFGDIVVPTEDVATFTRDGKRRITKRKLLPGYIMVNMLINDDTWFLVRETNGISDFTGAAGKPMPMEPADVERFILKPVDLDEDEEPAIKIGIPFKVGDRVRVKEGNFENQEGEVDGVDEANGRVTVIINIFGRSVPMELDHWQVEPL
jgi:transcriptional antiterminator NusG